MSLMCPENYLYRTFQNIFVSNIFHKFDNDPLSPLRRLESALIFPSLRLRDQKQKNKNNSILNRFKKKKILISNEIYIGLLQRFIEVEGDWDYGQLIHTTEHEKSFFIPWERVDLATHIVLGKLYLRWQITLINRKPLKKLESRLFDKQKLYLLLI